MCETGLLAGEKMTDVTNLPVYGRADCNRTPPSRDDS